MAVIICSKHGRQECAEVSPAFVKAIHDDTPLPFAPVVLHLNLFGKDGAFVWVDPQFLIDNNVETDDSQRSVVEDEDRAFDIFANLLPVCHVCYKNYLSTHDLQQPYLAIQKS